MPLRRKDMYFMYDNSAYHMDRKPRPVYPSLAVKSTPPVSAGQEEPALPPISCMSNNVRWISARSVRSSSNDATTDHELRAVRQTNGVYHAGKLSYVNMSRDQLFSWKGESSTGERPFSLPFRTASKLTPHSKHDHC